MSYDTDFNEIYGGSYVNAADVANGPIRHVIDRIEDKDDIRDKNGGNKRAWVAHFIGSPKPMILNKTNARHLVSALGTNYRAWGGTTLELFEVDTNTGKGVRVRVAKKPQPRDAAPPAGNGSGNDLDDPILF
jgi:hypothetical protein